MSVNIETIFEKTKEKYQLNIVAGEAGVINVLSWIYIMEDITTADFIRGNELIITTGLGIKSDLDFYNMIHILINQKASGLIVNTGNYIKSIPSNVIELCNKSGFPLLIMPWEIHLVDVTQEYCNWIIKDRQKQLNISECFYNILFSPEKVDVSQVKRFDYEIDAQYNTMILAIPKLLSDSENEEINKYFEIEVLSKIDQTTVKFCNVIHENKFIIIVQLNNNSAHKFLDNLQNVYRRNEKLQKGKIGVGSVQKGIFNLNIAYKHALAAFELTVRNQGETILYENMGVYKVLTEVQDREVLEKICIEYLGSIEEHDKIHKSQYMDTLRLYLKYNGSIQSVAEQSFSHRNTINYRIKKIKELLGNNLEDTNDKFMIQLCFYIKDMLDAFVK
jgi:hypothetical protein